MKIAIILAAICTVAFGAIAVDNNVQRSMLESNRVPKTKSDVSKNTLELVPKPASNSFCPECEAIILELVNVLKNPDDVKKLKAALKEYCPYMSMLVSQQECENIIENDLEAGLHELIPVLEDADNVCKELGFCEAGETGETNPMKPVFLKVMKIHVQSLKLGTGIQGTVCDECQLVVQEAVSLLESQEIQATIKKELEQYCTQLKTFKDECVSLIDQYFPIIVAKIKEYLGDTKAVCTDLGLCATTGVYRSAASRLLRPMESEIGRLIQREERNYPRLEMMARILTRLGTREGTTAGCIACETAFVAMLGILQGVPETQVAISNDVIAICKKVFPTAIGDQCDGFLTLYGPTAVHLAFDQLSAHGICKALNACSEIEAQFARQRTPEMFKGLQCEACEGAVQFLKIELKTPELQQEIVQLGTEVCNALPTKYQSACHDQMKEHVPQLMQVISNYLDTNLCKNLKVC